MNKNLKLTLFLTACLAMPALAEDISSNGDPMAGTGPFSNPEFQDVLETSDGYLNSQNTMKVRTDFAAPGDLRDAPISAVPTLKNPVPAAAKTAPALPKAEAKAQPRLPAGHYKVTFAGEAGPVGSFVWPIGDGTRKYAREYVFMSVTPVDKDYTKLLPRLEKECAFRFAGEKTFYARNTKRTVVLGWAPAANLIKISRLKGVQKAAVEKRGAGVPLKTRVRLTLKVPFQNRPNEFVPDFLKRLSEENGFTAEAWFRLPQKEKDSKFSVFDVTGAMPVDMIADISRSPFVAAVEFNDASL